MLKKRITLALAIIVCLGTLGACSSTKVSNKEKSAPELKWYALGAIQPEQQIVMETFNKKLKEKIGATLKVEMFEAATYDQKLNMIMASDEAYDLCFTSNWINKFNVAAAKGAFYELDDLIGKYAVGTKNALPSYIWDIAKYNDKIYAIPNYQIVAEQFAIFVQKGLAEKYSLDMNNVTKLNDIEGFLQKIKANEPQLYNFRASMASALIPGLLGRTDLDPIPGLPVWIERGDKQYKVKWDETDDIVVKGNEFFSDWYKKGYIRSDILSVSDDRSDQLANKYAVYVHLYKPGVEAQTLTTNKMDYIVKPLTQPYVTAVAGQTTMTAIGKKSKNPDKAMELIELMNTDKELYNLFVYGLEGQHYTKLSENSINITKNSKYNLVNTAYAYGNQLNSFYIGDKQEGIWEETDKMNRESEVSILRGFIPDLTNVKTEVAQVSAVQKEYKNVWAMPDWKTKYNEYIDKMKSAGIEKIVTEMQSQINKWAETK